MNTNYFQHTICNNLQLINNFFNLHPTCNKFSVWQTHPHKSGGRLTYIRTFDGTWYSNTCNYSDYSLFSSNYESTYINWRKEIIDGICCINELTQQLDIDIISIIKQYIGEDKTIPLRIHNIRII